MELLATFAPEEINVEHVGSTAVPGLAAKPVIDVLLGAASLSVIESRIPALSKRGYAYVSKYERELPMRRYFVNASVGGLRVHVHAVEERSTFWRDHLGFRDILRANGKVRSEYQALKLRLAVQHAEDKSAYTSAKGPFIQAVVGKLQRSKARSDGVG